MESIERIYMSIGRAKIPIDILSKNQFKILQCLNTDIVAEWTREQISATTGLARSTVYENLLKLADLGIVEVIHRHKSPHGRPPLKFCIAYALLEGTFKLKEGSK